LLLYPTRTRYFFHSVQYKYNKLIRTSHPSGSILNLFQDQDLALLGAPKNLRCQTMSTLFITDLWLTIITVSNPLLAHGLGASDKNKRFT